MSASSLVTGRALRPNALNLLPLQKIVQVHSCPSPGLALVVRMLAWCVPPG
jgi:hypothetical protein